MIVAGFGFRAAATADSLADALARAAGRGPAPHALAAPADKTGAPALRELAARLALPLRAVGPEALTRQPTLTRSTAAQAARGTGSVAEAAALAACGAGGRLLGPRAVSGDRLATCALAEETDP